MIKNISPIVLVYTVCAAVAYADVRQDVRAVMVQGKEIAIESDSGPVTLLTHDGVPKSLPVWSKDGEYIAFVEQADSGIALAKLVEIDRRGRLLNEVPIKPISPGEIASGMRYVESLQWLTANRIVASGSVNPSTVEYNILDPTNKKSVKEFFDDGHGAAFSPDGNHYAYVSGNPHFSPTGDRALTLSIDDKAVFSGTGDTEFVAAPLWSADGHLLGALMADQKGPWSAVIVNTRSSASVSLVSLPFEPNAREPIDAGSLFWSGNDLYLARKVIDTHPLHPVLGVIQHALQWWVLIESSGSWRAIETARVPENAVAKAKAARAEFKKSVETAGVKDYDFWCQNCDLSALPRRSPTIE